MTESIDCIHNTDVCHNSKSAYCLPTVEGWGEGGAECKVRGTGTGSDFRHAPDLTVRPQPKSKSVTEIQGLHLIKL